MVFYIFYFNYITLLFKIDIIPHLTYKESESHSGLSCLNSYNQKMVEPRFKTKSYLNIIFLSLIAEKKRQTNLITIFLTVNYK